MSATAAQPAIPSLFDDAYTEAALETAAGLRKISKFATRLEDWFDLWSEHIIMPPLGVMQQAASLISRMTSVRKTLVQALNSLEPPDVDPASPPRFFDGAPAAFPEPSGASSATPSDPLESQIPNSSSSSASLLKEAARLSNEVYAETRRLAKASGFPFPSPVDLDLDPTPTPPPPLQPTVPTTPNLSIRAIRSCPTIPLDQLPAATAVLEDKLQRLIASSSEEEFNKLPQAEAEELIDHIKKTRGAEWWPPEFLSTVIFSSEYPAPAPSSTKFDSPPKPPPRHPPPGS